MTEKTLRRSNFLFPTSTIAFSVLFSLLTLMPFMGNTLGAQTKPRIISFSGYDWEVKTSAYSPTGKAGPGNNYFSDSRRNVRVDKNGWLHLKITRQKNRFYCAEVILTKPPGYKKFIFHLSGNPDHFHRNVVAGLFTYRDGTDHAEEIDIEFSKWGDSQKTDIAQYALQPAGNQGNTKSFDPALNGDASTHLFDWKPGWVDFASYHGHYSSVPDTTLIINRWRYTGPDVPKDPQNGKIHINLWLFRGETLAPSEHPEAELVIKRFIVL